MTHLGCFSFFVHLELKLYLKGLGIGDLRPKYFACGLRNTTGFLLWWLCSLKSFLFFPFFLKSASKKELSISRNLLWQKKNNKKKPPKYEQIRTLGFTLGLPRDIEWDAIA